MSTGSIKVRRDKRGINIRATGIAAARLAAALANTVVAQRMRPLTTIHFSDEGQDFLEWDIDGEGKVVECRPYHGAIWIGTQTIGRPAPGEPLRIVSKRSGKETTIVHRVDAVHETWQEAVS